MSTRRVSLASNTKRRYSLNGSPVMKADGDGEELVPLINVVFLLMVFFLLAGSISKRDDLALEPPESITELKRVPASQQLRVMPNGSLRLDGKAIALEDLTSQGLNQVEIQADAQTNVGLVKPVLAALQSAGVSEVRLLTRRP